MASEQILVFGVLAGTLVLFITARLRYGLVALLALLVLTGAGIVPADQAFAGFSHPAVATVAAVLVISRGLLNAGVVDAVASVLTRVGDRVTIQVAALCVVAAVASAFMNNVGALALLLPVAIRMGRRSGTPASLLLMPLAFASLLGGMTTLIGTPPNIIIGTFRARDGLEAFRMFDFSPVGSAVALAGVVFLAALGWRLLPRRQGLAGKDELFEIAHYITELRIPEGSPLVGQRLSVLEKEAGVELTVVGYAHGDRHRPAPSGLEVLRAGDIVLVEAEPDDLQAMVERTGLELAGGEALSKDVLGSEEIGLLEVIVKPGSPLVNRTVVSLNLRRRVGINVLAVARHGARMIGRLKRIRFQPGDTLLLQGGTETLQEALSTLECLPLAERGLRIGQPRRILASVAIFAVALIAAALGLVPVQLALLSAAVGMIMAGMLTLREAYDSIEWPIIVLLGAMLPVGAALESTGGAQLIADGVLAVSRAASPAMTLGIVLVATMFLSDLVNNAAVAVLMAPIGLRVASGMNVSPDALLMAVAIGASSAFLTPIGHQSNTMVLNPGGYRFGDYWRVGLPLEVIIVLTAVPLLLRVWAF